MDFTPYLSIKSSKIILLCFLNLLILYGIFVALEFRKWIGGEEALNTYCHDLAVKGGKRLAEILGTKVLDEDGELTLNMV